MRPLNLKMKVMALGMVCLLTFSPSAFSVGEESPSPAAEKSSRLGWQKSASGAKTSSAPSKKVVAATETEPAKAVVTAPVVSKAAPQPAASPKPAKAVVSPRPPASVLVPVAAAKSDPLPAYPDPVAEPKITVSKDALKDKVKTLREERQARMPYLSKAFIHESITPEKIRATEAFSGGGPKSLDDVLKRAVGVYTPAIAGRERVVLAKRKILAAIRGLGPEVTAEYNMKKGSLSAEPFGSRAYKVSVHQPIFHGGSLWNALLQEKAGLEIAQKEYIATLEDLVSEVAAAYVEYHRSLQAVKFQQEVLKTLNKYLGMSKTKYKEQLISEIESLNVESLVSLTQYDHETSKQELELARLDLQRYLSLSISEPVEVSSLYDINKMVVKKKAKGQKGGDDVYELGDDNPGDSLSDLVDLAYQHRASLQVDSYKLDSARIQEKIRAAEFMPKLDFTIDFGKLSEAFIAVTDSPGFREDFRFLLEFSWNLGGNKLTYSFENDEKAPSVAQFQQNAGSQTSRHSLQAELFAGLADWVSTKEVEIQKLDQITQLEKTEKEVVHDVKQSYFDYQKAKIKVRSSIQRFNYRKRLGAYSKHRLGKNEIQISEYLQSEIDILTEAVGLHKALADYYTAKAKLNHAIGIRNYFPIKELHGNTAQT